MRPRALLAGLLVLVLGLGCTSWKRFAYEGWGRDSWQQPERVIEALALAPGARVADLGSGGGYFSFRLARAVGPQGRVYAVDVDRGLDDYVAQRAREEGLANLDVILADYDDPHLPAEGVDLLFTCNTYHHIEGRSEYFARIRSRLRPGARVAIVDFSDKSWFARVFGHTTPAATIRSEMEAAGYTLVAQHDFLSRQHFLVFAPLEGAGAR